MGRHTGQLQAYPPSKHRAECKEMGAEAIFVFELRTERKNRKKWTCSANAGHQVTSFLKKNVARNYSCCSLLKAGPKMTTTMMCRLQCAHSSIKPFLRREFLTRWTHFPPFYLVRAWTDWHTVACKNLHVSKDQLLYSRSPIPWQGFETWLLWHTQLVIRHKTKWNFLVPIGNKILISSWKQKWQVWLNVLEKRGKI